jgi:hypothetical protein
MSRDNRPTLSGDEIVQVRIDSSKLPQLDTSRITQLPEQSRLFQLPMDPDTLAQLPVDTSRLMRLPVDHSGLMRLPIDPNSEVERQFFGKRLEPEPEYFDDTVEPEAAPALPRRVWRRPVVMLLGLVVLAGGGTLAARSLGLADAWLPPATTVAVVTPPAPAAQAAPPVEAPVRATTAAAPPVHHGRTVNIRAAR